MSDDDLRGRFRRDYTKEPIRQSNAKSETPVAPTKNKEAYDIQSPSLENITRKPRKAKKPRKRFKFFKIFFVLLIIGVLSAAGYSYYIQNQVVPRKIQDQAEIPVLYPTKLPEGFKIVKNSFSVTNGNIISYYAQDHSNNRLLFTVQSRPSNFDFEQFYSKSLTKSTKFTTQLGEGAAGTAGDRLLGSLATEQSWILITANNPTITVDKIVIALKSLKKTD